MAFAAILGMLSLFPAHGYSRIVSLNLCTDQLLIALAPEKILALSLLSRDARYAVNPSRYPVVAADAESVLRLHPDLVVAAPFGATAAQEMLRAAGVTIWRTQMPQDFAGIARETLALGTLLGVPDRARKLVDQMDQALAVPARDRGSALLIEPRLYLSDAGTLGDAVLRAAGYRNAAGQDHLSLEALLESPPDLLVLDDEPGFPSLATDLLDHPALAHLARRRVNPAWLICAGPWSARAVAALAAP